MPLSEVGRHSPILMEPWSEGGRHNSILWEPQSEGETQHHPQVVPV